MQYINTETNTRVTHEVLLALHHNTSFPEGLDFVPPAPYVAIAPSEKPTFDKQTQQAVQAAPVLVDGQYVQGWDIIEIFSTQEEKDAALLAFMKERRDKVTAKIAKEAEARKQGGVFVESKWFHTDLYSRTKWLAMMNAAVPAIEIATMDESLITTSPELATLVFLATAQLDVSVLNHSKSLSSAVASSEEPETIDIVLGWPVVYSTTA